MHKNVAKTYFEADNALIDEVI